jgi:hypothetical protein
LRRLVVVVVISAGGEVSAIDGDTHNRVAEL